MDNNGILTSEELLAFISENQSAFTFSSPEDFVIKENTLVKYKGTATIVDIPENVNIIAKRAFLGSDIIIAILPEGLSRIEKHAFQLCDNLMIVKIPSTLRFIGDSAFSGCPNLSKIELPQKMDEIDTLAFSKSGLDKISFPEQIDRVGEAILSECHDLETLEIPGCIHNVPIMFASGCSKLQTVVLNDGVEKVSISAFAKCPALREITVPDSLTDLSRAFGKKHHPIKLMASSAWRNQHSEMVVEVESGNI